MNILHVVRPADGGMKNHLLTLAAHLDPDRYRIFIAGPDAQSYQAKISDRDVVCRDLPLKGEISPLADAQCILRLTALMKKEGIHLVHTHGMKAGLVGRLAARVAHLTGSEQGLPRVLSTVHNSVYNYPWPGLEKKFIGLVQRYLARETDCFITVSQALKKEIMDWERVDDKKVQVIYNGIPVGAFQKKNSPYLKMRLGLNPLRPVIGTVARLAPQKGVSFFIQAAFLVSQLAEDAQFLIVGDGPLRGELEAEAKRLGLNDRLVFAGFYPEISDIYPLMDVFVVPSLSEGLSITTIEAMAAGRPIVAAAVGGILELISHRQTGFLVPSGDSQALAHGILELLKRPRWASKMAVAAREKANADFTVEQMIARTEILYGEIASELGLATLPGRCVHAGA